MFALLAACDAGASIFASIPWEPGQVAILLVTDAGGQPIEPSPQLLEGESATRVLVETNEPFRLVVQVYALSADEAANLRDCGPTLSGDGALLPAPLSTWTSPMISETDVPREISLAADPAAVPIEVRSCPGARPEPCREVEVTILPLDDEGAARTFHELAFIGESQVVLREDPSEASTGGLYRIDLDTRAETRLSGENPVAIAADRRGGFFAAHADGRLTRVLADGREDFAARLPCALRGVTAAETSGAIAWGSDCVYALWGTSSSATALDGFPAPPEDVLLVDAGRIGAVADRSLHTFNGVEWRREHDDVNAGVRLAGNDRRFAAAGQDQVLLRDEASQTWTDLPPPEFPGRILALAVTPEGRPLVVGENGLSHLWMDGSWCLIPGSIGWHLDIDVSTDGQRAAALSGNQGRYAIVLYDLRTH